MADGGFFDKLLKDDSSSLKTVVSPILDPDTTDREGQRVQRLQCLEALLEEYVGTHASLFDSATLPEHNTIPHRTSFHSRVQGGEQGPLETPFREDSLSL